MKWMDALTIQTQQFIKSVEPIISMSGALDKSHSSNMHTLLTGNCDPMNSMYDCSPLAGHLGYLPVDVKWAWTKWRIAVDVLAESPTLKRIDSRRAEVSGLIPSFGVLI